MGRRAILCCVPRVDFQTLTTRCACAGAAFLAERNGTGQKAEPQIPDSGSEMPAARLPAPLSPGEPPAPISSPSGIELVTQRTSQASVDGSGVVETTIQVRVVDEDDARLAGAPTPVAGAGAEEGSPSRLIQYF